MGEKGKREKEEGRGEMKSISEQRRVGEGRELGWEKAGRRLHTRRWRKAEARRRCHQPAPPPLRRRKVCSSDRPRAPWDRRRAASVNPTGPPVFVLGDLALLSSLSKSSWIQALQALAFARALTPRRICPSGPRIGQIAPPRGQVSGPLRVYLEMLQV